MSDRLLVGCWDCSYCGTKKVSGEMRECPNCGHPRDKDVHFYMDTPKQYVSNPDAIDQRPDWVCSYCDSLNPASSTICKGCGAERGADTLDYFENHAKMEAEKTENISHGDSGPMPTGASDSYRAEANYFEDQPSNCKTSGYHYTADAEERSSSANPQNNWIIQGQKQQRRKKLFRISAIIGIIAVFVGLLCFLLIPRQEEITVAACRWERQVEVEKYTEVSDSGWSLPAGAYDVTERTEIHHYDSVLDHYETKYRQASKQVFDGYDTYYTYEDLGNGYFKEVPHQEPKYRTEYYSEPYEEAVYKQVPRYQTKYYYLIMRWITDHWEKTSGQDTEPYFATIEETATIRAGDKTEKYWIESTEGKKYDASYDIWEQCKAGDTIKVKTRLGQIVELVGRDPVNMGSDPTK